MITTYSSITEMTHFKLFSGSIKNFILMLVDKLHLVRTGFVFLILVSIIVLGSCAAEKKMLRAPLNELGDDYLFQKMVDSQPDFSTLSMRASIQYKDKKNDMDLKANIRNAKDSAIWISVSPLLGIEAARVMFTKDSVKLIDRFNKAYFSGDYAFFADFYKLDFDYDIIQSLLLGNDVKGYDRGELKASVDNKMYYLRTSHRRKFKKEVLNHRDENRCLFQDIWLDPVMFRINKIKLKEVSNQDRELQVEYRDFSKLLLKQLASEIIVEVIDKEKINIVIKYSKVTVNEEISFPITIPSGYEPIHFSKE